MKTFPQLNGHSQDCPPDRPAHVALPLDRNRPPVSSYVRASVRRQIAAELTHELNALAAREHVAIQVLLMAAFTALLFRLTGQNDILIGASVNAIGGPEPEEPIALRVTLAEGLTALGLIRQIQANDMLGLRKENGSAAGVLDDEGSFLFNTAFVMIDSSAPIQDLYRLSELSKSGFADGLTQCDLALGAWEQNEKLALVCEFDAELFDASTVELLLERFEILLAGMASNPTSRVCELPLLPPAERHKLLVEWNQTATALPDQCIHRAFEVQVERTPDAIAAVLEHQALTYRELNVQANKLAHHLISLGVGPDVRVGICMGRSLEMLVSLLAILKAGGAYVPLDPGYPRDRLNYMLQNANVLVVLTRQRLMAQSPAQTAQLVCLDLDRPKWETNSIQNPGVPVKSDHLAYVMYTSGSTGKPKGVMITHRNVTNFFTGMDQSIGSDPGVWLAVTSISFDISVLELFWTLTRGFKVVIAGDDHVRRRTADGSKAPHRTMDFSLFYFASDAGQKTSDPYRLLLEGAKFADENGFAAVWTPERHFNAFGGLYPNPAVTGAAVAAVTRRVRIMAGSVILPLHNPISVAEDWAMVDKLSQGRAGVSFTSGWQANDFVFAPQHYAARKKVMVREIETVRKLWRGEAVSVPGVDGQPVNVKTLPRPVQAELPISITAAGNPETFQLAGELGADVLTHLIGQEIADLGKKILIYQQARQAGGHAGKGRVTVMLHTFVGGDLESVRETVRGPFSDYLKDSVELLKNCPQAFAPATPPAADAPASKQASLPARDLTSNETTLLVEHAFERYFEKAALFGTPETCLRMVGQLQAIGVDEIACLIDFGVDPDLVLKSLPQLDLVRESSNTAVEIATDDFSFAGLMTRHQVTHLQCTPSMAGMLLGQTETRAALGKIRQLMVGGEPLPVTLAHQLREVTPATIHNMYGPTETTVWSTTGILGEGTDTISIGRPIANTQVYLLDDQLQLVPIGMPGELCIGGAGVARGYWMCPELTREKFVPNPFSSDAGGRIYKTGDLARFLPDGTISFIGRKDHQVKLRGYRIELGEIEALLNAHPTIGQSAVIVREDIPDDKRLVAYVTPASGQTPDASQLRNYLKEKLPEFMLPCSFVMLDMFPQTPNRKIDRKALPAPGAGHGELESGAAAARPRTKVEQALADIWAETLGVTRVNRCDDFFRLGGNELLAKAVIQSIEEACQVRLSSQILSEAPVLMDFAREVQKAFLQEATAAETLQSSPGPELPNGNTKHELPPHLLLSTQSPLEQALASIWAEILQRDQVGLKANFFELGGHSLLGTQLISRLRSIFKLDLSLRTLFDAPTVEGFARAMLAAETNPGQLLRVARIINQIDGMSAAESEAILREKREIR